MTVLPLRFWRSNHPLLSNKYSGRQTNRFRLSPVCCISQSDLNFCKFRTCENSVTELLSETLFSVKTLLSLNFKLTLQKICRTKLYQRMKHYEINKDMRYLQLLAQSFPTVAEAPKSSTCKPFSTFLKVQNTSWLISTANTRLSCMCWKTHRETSSERWTNSSETPCAKLKNASYVRSYTILSRNWNW